MDPDRGLLAAALNPAVEAFERRGMTRVWSGEPRVRARARRPSSGIGFLVIPPLVTQVADFIDAVPDFIDDITAGRGPLGFLQDEYQIVDRIREAIESEGAAGVLGLSEPVLDVVRSVVTAVVGTITVVFLTYFMLLEGPRTIQRTLALLPTARGAVRARVGRRCTGRSAATSPGNLLISLVAGRRRRRSSSSPSAATTRSRSAWSWRSSTSSRWPERRWPRSSSRRSSSSRPTGCAA